MLPSAVSDSRVHNILPNKIDTDFQFSRASSATRVNHQGLIEDVGYFSSELVQNGDFSELGPEIITNGDNIQESEWTLGVGWSVSNGKLVANTNSNSTCAQLDSFTTGKTYKIVFTVSNYVSGQVRPQLAGSGSANGQNVSANGTYTQYIVAIANHNKFRFQATSNNFTGSISNVSVKQVDPNDRWTLGTGWSYGNGVVSSDGSQSGDSDCTQNLSTPAGKTYKVTYTISQYSAGGVFIRLASGNVTTTQTSAGTFSEILNGADGTQVKIRANSTFVGTISNISVVEVIGDKPRLDYNPTNPTCPHLLLEPQSTNLVTFSEDFSGYTTNNSSILSNVISSPDGSLSASKLIENTATAEHTIQKQVSVTSGNAYSISVFVKKDEISSVQFGFTGSNFASPTRSIFDIENGIITTNVSNTASIQNYGNGWYKLKVTNTTNATGTAMLILQTIKSGQANYTGDGVSGFYMWGLQWEQQTYCTSYIPTAGSTETRVGESCFIPGIDNGILNQNAFTLLLDTSVLNDTVNNFLELIILYNSSDPSTTNLRFESRTNGQVYVQHQNCVNSGANFNSATFGSNSVDFKNFLISCSTSEVKIWADSNKINDYSGSYVFAFDRIGFRNNTGIVETILKHNAVALYNRVLTDTESYTITSTQYSAYSGMVAALGNYTIPC